MSQSVIPTGSPRSRVSGISEGRRSLGELPSFWISLDRIAVEFSDAWRLGSRPDLAAYWRMAGGDDSESRIALAALIKLDLGLRFEAGEDPRVSDYLERFPALREDRERVVSLVYEEYCLREERGDAPLASEFCNRYPDWRDSLVSQLNYHRLLSQVVGKPTKPHFPRPGETFARTFLLRSVLGEGGAARVYLAEQSELGGRRVALKVSTTRGKEPSIQGRLDHAHIVPVWSVTEDEQTGLRGLCMPYRPGRPLNEVIAQVQPGTRPRSALALWDALEVAESEADAAAARPLAECPGWALFPRSGSYADGVAWFISTIARALAHAHDRGILHRDVKPANILLTRRDGPQLLDFNLAHDPYAPDQAEAALRGGTLPYMAPEQLRAFLTPETWHTVGRSADIYALGLVFQEMLTGQLPRTPSDPDLPLPRMINAMLDLRATGFGSARDANPDIPHALCAILKKCLAYNENERYTDPGALLEDLERYLARRPLRYAENRSRRERSANWVFRNQRRLMAVVVGCAVIGLGGLIWRFAPGDVTKDEDAYIMLARDRLYKATRLLVQEPADSPLVQEQVSKARENYNKALMCQPSSYLARIGLAYIADKFDLDPESSLRLLNEAIVGMRSTEKPNAPLLGGALVNRAFLLCSKAEKQWGKNDSTEAWLALEKDYQRAKQDLDRARHIFREYLQAPYTKEQMRDLVRLEFVTEIVYSGLYNVEGNRVSRPIEVDQEAANRLLDRVKLAVHDGYERARSFAPLYPEEFEDDVNHFREKLKLLGVTAAE